MAQITAPLINLWRKRLAAGYHINSTRVEEAALLDAWEELQKLKSEMEEHECEHSSYAPR